MSSIRQAAQGEVLHNDDTSMRVLHLAREPSDERTGVFTSGIVSTQQGQRIALYFTGRQHAGENLRDVLDHRAGQLATPVQMCDALSRNTPKLDDGTQILLANCLAHGRRQFVEVAANFPEACRYVLETLGSVYKYDAEARATNLSPLERLLFHQQHSQPVMEKLQQWMEAQFAQHLVEPNSGLGKAITYFLRHWKGLTAFLREAGAPLDNNLCERALKRAVLHRKNASVLSHAARLGGRGPVHEPDPYLRTGGRQCLRLPQPVAAPRRRTGSQSHRVDALELPGALGLKPLVSGHHLLHSGNAQKTGFPENKIPQGFWPPPSVSAFMPVFPRMINRRFPCNSTPCATSPQNETGPSLCRSTRLAAAHPNANCDKQLLAAARRRDIDVVLVWRLDRWGRSVADLVSTLQELQHLGVGFVSLTEALDLTTPVGRAMAGLLAVFAEFEREILRERVRAGLAHARQNGKHLGRPPSAAHKATQVRSCTGKASANPKSLARIKIGRTSVRRLLAPKKS